MVEGTVGCGGVAFLMSRHDVIFSRIFCNHRADKKAPKTPSPHAPCCQAPRARRSPGSGGSIHGRRKPKTPVLILQIHSALESL